MVLGNRQEPGRPTIWMTAGQGPFAFLGPFLDQCIILSLLF